MPSPDIVTVDPDINIKPCPFCGGKTVVQRYEPYGYWGPDFYAQYHEYAVHCRDCKADGPRTRVPHFGDWSDHSVAEFREDKDLWKREHDRFVKEVEKPRLQEAIDKWNGRI